MNIQGHRSRRRQQLDLLARAAQARPDDEGCARRYANAAIRANDPDATIAAHQQLVAIAPADAQAWQVLCEALLKRNRPREAEAAGRIAASLLPGNASALAMHGYALRADLRDNEADLVFEKASALDPQHRGAARGYGQALMRKGDFVALKRHVEHAMEAIGLTTWMVSQYMIALAMLGDRRTLAALIDYDRHVATNSIEVPHGFGSLAQFNHALLDELDAIASANGGAALDVVRNGQRIEGGPLLAVDWFGPQGAPASAGLLGQAQQHLDRYLEGLGHALPARYRPATFKLTTDAIVSNHLTYLTPHTHASSWMNMVYYVAVPDGVRSGEPAGCMEFCAPRHKAAIPEDCWPSHVITPQAGVLALFPGYLYHRVNPMATQGRRVAIAFDMFPSHDSYLPGIKPEVWLAGLDQE